MGCLSVSAFGTQSPQLGLFSFKCAGLVSVSVSVHACTSGCQCGCGRIRGGEREGPAHPPDAAPCTCEALGVDDDPLHGVGAAVFFVLLQAQGDLLGRVLE